MGSLVNWSVIVAILLPLAISAIKNDNGTVRYKKWLSLAISVVATLVTVGAAEGWTFTTFGAFADQLVVSFPIIFGGAKVTYEAFWKNSALDAKLASLRTKYDEGYNPGDPPAYNAA